MRKRAAPVPNPHAGPQGPAVGGPLNELWDICSSEAEQGRWDSKDLGLPKAPGHRVRLRVKVQLANTLTPAGSWYLSVVTSQGAGCRAQSTYEGVIRSTEWASITAYDSLVLPDTAYPSDEVAYSLASAGLTDPLTAQIQASFIGEIFSRFDPLLDSILTERPKGWKEDLEVKTRWWHGTLVP